MPTFAIRYGTSQGTLVTEERKAESAAALRRQLEGEGLFVFEVSPRGPGLAVRRPGRRVGARDLLVLNQELLALVRAGLPIVAALDLLVERARNRRLRQVLSQVREAVKGGSALSDAAAAQPRIFSRLYAASLRAGEQSGSFPEALARYVEYQKRMLALRKKVTQAALYPAVLAGASAAVVIFLMTFVVPTFTRIYGDLEARLPLPTQVLIGTTRLVRDLFPLAAGGIAVAALALWRWRQGSAGRQIMDRWALRLPVLGNLLGRYAISRFCRTLGMVLGGGIPMVPALEVAAGAVGNAHVRSRLEGTIRPISSGSSLAGALEASGIAPGMSVEMIAVGESTGALVEMLGHVADFLDEELEVRLNSLASLIEPAIMLTMGIVVAGIVITMYLPIFNLASVVR